MDNCICLFCLDHRFSFLSTAAAKLLQSCPTLCDPIDSSPLGSSVPGILQATTLEWVAISFSNAWKWKVKVKLLSCVRLFATAWTAAYQAPPPMGFSRQEYWSGVPMPSPFLSTIGSEFMFLAIIQSKTILEPKKEKNNNKQSRKTLTSIKYNYQTFIEVFSLWLFSIHHFVAKPLYIATFILNYSCTFPQLYLSFCQLCPIFKCKHFNLKMLKII